MDEMGQKQKVHSSVLEQTSRYNELLNFAGSVENSKCPGVPKQALHRRTPSDAKAPKNLHCLINDVEGGLARIKFRNCGFTGNALLGGIMLPSGAIHQKCSRIYADRHVSQLSLDKLMF